MLDFKVEVWACGQHCETRMFNVEEDVASDFVLLRKKLESKFPKLEDKNYYLQWTNKMFIQAGHYCYNDITIQNGANDELQIAIKRMKSTLPYICVFKIFIQDDWWVDILSEN